MARQPLENLLPKAGNSVYRLVRMASNRALELLEGRRCLIKQPSTDKVTTMALEEISFGRVVFKGVENLLVKSDNNVDNIDDNQKKASE